jgi:hypothetical protein
MSLKNAAAEAPLRVRTAGPNMSENLLGKKVEAKGKAGEIVPVYPVLRLKEFKRVSVLAGLINRLAFRLWWLFLLPP